MFIYFFYFLRLDEVKEEEGVEDDRCFVCGEGGKLILCDFPNCPRVYHQVSVIGQTEGSKYKERKGEERRGKQRVG